MRKDEETPSLFCRDFVYASRTHSHKHRWDSQDPISKAGTGPRMGKKKVHAWEAPLPPSERIGDCDQFNHENLDSKVN